MQTLVVGGTGTVGSEVVRQLLAHGIAPRVLVRSLEKATTLPAGATPIVGDFTRRETLPRAFQGCRAVFLLNAIGPQETPLGLTGLHTAVAGRAERVVYLSVTRPPGSERIPHFASKIPVIDAIRRSGIDWTILSPNNFFQNDAAVREAIVQHGVYPLPIGQRGINRVDVRDVAEIAVKALTEDGHTGREYDIHGPDALTGDGVAATWSRVLDREVRYAGDDLDAWAAGALAAGMAPWLLQNLRTMYAYFQEQGLAASDGALAAEQRLLGRQPRSFADYAAEMATAWTGHP
jgi:uncharacterized protein YbjT (DUF2867 family)